MIGPKESFCDLIDAALLKEYSDKEETSYPLRPSASGYCQRKLAYKVAEYHGYRPQVKEDRKANVVRLLSLGHHIEAHAIEYIERLPGWVVGHKQQSVNLFKLPSGRWISGSIDFTLTSSDGKHKGIADCKSVGDRWSSSYSTKWEERSAMYDRMNSLQKFGDNAWYADDLDAFLGEIGEDPLYANTIQVNAYLHSSWAKELEFQFGVIYRYHKNSSKHQEIRFRPSAKVFEKLKTKYALIEAAGAANEPEAIKKEYPLGSEACSYCPYKSECWPEANATREYWKTQPKKNWAVRLEEAPSYNELLKLFSEREGLEKNLRDMTTIDQKILLLLDNDGLFKVKLDTGDVFEVVQLKSPRPRLELRRGKE